MAMHILQEPWDACNLYWKDGFLAAALAVLFDPPSPPPFIYFQLLHRVWLQKKSDTRFKAWMRAHATRAVWRAKWGAFTEYAFSGDV